MCGILMNVGSADTIGFKKSFDNIGYRGPTMSQTIPWGDALFGFHRLSIMDVSTKGMQPFIRDDLMIMSNGEIYNYEALKETVRDYRFESSSDCEVLLPLYVKHGVEMVKFLDAEFALAGYDKKTKSVFAARDAVGIRPLFYGYDRYGLISFASEAKGLLGICEDIHPFPPGHYYEDGEFVDYRDLFTGEPIKTEEAALQIIRQDLISAVRKRLMSDVEVGFLLSGGLDSSLVCAIAAEMIDKPITTFAVGMQYDAIDLKYARDVAEKIGSVHHEVIMTFDDVLSSLKDVIWRLETWDTTTIRASVGMVMLCKYISEQTDIKVILTGEVSDELFGYKYTDFAPDAAAFQQESIKRIKELYMYDVLRADRCISSCGLEGRVPFADKEFVRNVMAIDPKLKMNTRDVGKYLLRQAFKDDNLLPEHILWRQKAAFSDAVGHSMVDELKRHAEVLYPEFDAEAAAVEFPYCPPLTSEAYMYRKIFVSLYPQGQHWIKDYWMPNQDWLDEKVIDPSARVLSNYDQSGT